MPSHFEKLAYLSNLPNAAAAASDWFAGAMGRVKSLATPQPDAYSRITRTPIYIKPTGENMAGQYEDGAITVSPQHLDVIPHESAHAIYDQAHLKDQAAALAPTISENTRNRILNSPLYRSMGDYSGSPEQLSDEGLGMSIGDRDETGYVNRAAQAIKDPTLADRLRRLNLNALGSRPLD